MARDYWPKGGGRGPCLRFTCTALRRGYSVHPSPTVKRVVEVGSTSSRFLAWGHIGSYLFLLILNPYSDKQKTNHFAKNTNITQNVTGALCAWYSVGEARCDVLHEGHPAGVAPWLFTDAGEI